MELFEEISLTTLSQNESEEEVEQDENSETADEDWLADDETNSLISNQGLNLKSFFFLFLK